MLATINRKHRIGIFFEAIILQQQQGEIKAKVQVFENNYSKSMKTNVHTEFLSYLFTAKLYQKNKLVFESPGLPQLSLDLTIGQTYTNQERQERFNKSQPPPSESRQPNT